MPMQPSPMAETSRLLLPSLRFCIFEFFISIFTSMFEEDFNPSWRDCRTGSYYAGCGIALNPRRPLHWWVNRPFARAAKKWARPAMTAQATHSSDCGFSDLFLKVKPLRGPLESRVDSGSFIQRLKHRKFLDSQKNSRVTRQQLVIFTRLIFCFLRIDFLKLF